MYKVKFNYDYLISLIEKKYECSSINKSYSQFCSDVKTFTPMKFMTILNGRSYFNNADISRISEVLELNNDEIAKCFLTLSE